MADQSMAKVERRCKKLMQKLQNMENIPLSNRPSKHLIILNIGLMCGVGHEEMYNTFSAYGCIEDLLMLPGKSWSVVTFTSTEESVRAFADVNGKLPEQLDAYSSRVKASSGTDVTVYLAYLHQDVSEMAGRVEEMTVILTGSEPHCPPGLTLLPNYIDADGEAELIDVMASDSPDNANTTSGSLRHRRVRHYGYEFSYDDRAVNRHRTLEPIPEVCLNVIRRLMDEKLITSLPDQLTINEYKPGQGIPSHVDTHSSFEDELIIVSVGSHCVMTLKPEAIADPRVTSLGVYLKRGSVLILRGEARYAWSHGITPRTTDLLPTTSTQHSRGETSQRRRRGINVLHRGTRLSYTYRTVRASGRCECRWPSMCDTQLGSRDDTHDESHEESVARQLEATHVHAVYQQIAPHFSYTRHSPWPRVAQFITDLPAGSLLLDVGCGNGKYLGLNREIYSLGSDYSSELSALAYQRGYPLVTADVLRLPTRSDVFDAVICIAVIHHLATKGRRLDAIKELVRVTKPGGQILIYVWAMEQRYGGKKSAYVKDAPSECTSECCQTSHDGDTCAGTPNLQDLPVHKNRTPFVAQDLLVPWHLRRTNCNGGKLQLNGGSDSLPVYQRYYHVFKEHELLHMCSEISGVTPVNSYFDQGNWCIVLNKA